MIFDEQASRAAETAGFTAQPGHERSRILITDDEPEILRVLERILSKAGYTNVKGISRGAELIEAVETFQPDLLLLDVHLPDADGLSLLREVRASARARRTFLPILVLTGDATTAVREKALAAGATDFLTKPFARIDVLLRINNLLDTRSLHVDLQAQLERAKMEVLEKLARAADSRDNETFDHARRVASNAARLASAAGVAPADVDLIRQAAPLHDIGKIGVTDAILRKQGLLTPAEYDEQKKHTSIGAEILEGSEFPVINLAAEIAHTHHERWDGQGYPRGLSGGAIPLAGRIVSVADVYDALVHARPYKHAWSIADALDELRRNAGSQFDAHLVALFIAEFTNG